MPPRRLLLLALVPAVLLPAVLLAVGDGAAAAPREPRHPAVEPDRSPRAVIPNTAPSLAAPVEIVGTVGRAASVPLGVHDAETDDVTVDAGHHDGLVAVEDAGGSWRLWWVPRATGTSVVRIMLTDEHGASREVRVRLRATNPARPGSLLGLGDSVASGHGLQKRDYLGRDDCWRSEREAYPWLVREGLVDSGVLDEDGDYHLVACSGATLADLLGEPVTGGPSDLRPEDSDRRTQVDWAVAANPEIVTLTAGANTLGFTDPWSLVGPDGSLDEAELARRLDRVRNDLIAVLRRLVDHTDAHVVVTNYYNPAARRPQGVGGCEGACFRRHTDDVVHRLDVTIREVVARFPYGRVTVVDLVDAFADHGAPNGLGPDGLRAGSVGWLRGVIGAPVEGVHPYCAEGHDDGGSWINYVDCVHPDGRGHREIADLMLAELEAG